MKKYYKAATLENVSKKNKKNNLSNSCLHSVAKSLPDWQNSLIMNEVVGHLWNINMNIIFEGGCCPILRWVSQQAQYKGMNRNHILRKMQWYVMSIIKLVNRRSLHKLSMGGHMQATGRYVSQCYLFRTTDKLYDIRSARYSTIFNQNNIYVDLYSCLCELCYTATLMDYCPFQTFLLRPPDGTRLISDRGS